MQELLMRIAVATAAVVGDASAGAIASHTQPHVLLDPSLFFPLELDTGLLYC